MKNGMVGGNVMLACLVTDLSPRSIQSEKLDKYKTRIIDVYKSQGFCVDGVPFSTPLYSKVIYIHLHQTTIDVDNMSKPLVDAFKGILYDDDKIINHRVCSKISLSDLDSYELNLTVLPAKIAEKLDELFSLSSEHILYYEIGNFSESMVYMGGERYET